MKVSDLFQRWEAALTAQAESAGIIQHAGDRGGAREEALRQFLGGHLPKKYGVTKGEVVTKDGQHSHSADVIVYDAVNCPILYVGGTQVLPMEGVYGIIEVKSALSKAEFVDAATKIANFKRLAPRDLSVIQTREYVTVHRPSRPFGAILAFDLADNSMDSLGENWTEINGQVHDVNFFTNLVAVLGSGLLLFELVDWVAGTIGPLLDTDQFVDLILAGQKWAAEGGKEGRVQFRHKQELLGDRTFGRFVVHVLMMLERLKLGIPDLGQYVDPTLPLVVHRES
jgi:hypothetical protein